MKGSFLSTLKTLLAAGMLLVLFACVSPLATNLPISTEESLGVLNTPTPKSVVNSVETPSPTPTFDIVSIIPRWTPDSAESIPTERWKQYEMAILGACYSHVSLPAEKLCEWDVIATQNNEVYVWAFCIDEQGRGRSGPVAIYLNSQGNIDKALCPVISAESKALFPTNIYVQILGYQFDLDKAWVHLEQRFRDRTIPPLIVVEGTPLP